MIEALSGYDPSLETTVPFHGEYAAWDLCGLETQFIAFEENTAVQSALEKEFKERSPTTIQEPKEVRRKINNLEKQKDALQKEGDDNKASLRLIPTGNADDVEM